MNVHALLEQSGWLNALARHVVRSAEAADVVQDTWMACLTAPPPVNVSVRGWLAGVLRNRARSACAATLAAATTSKRRERRLPRSPRGRS